MPITVTALRGFLGLTNYYGSYVENYAKFAAPLTAKLQLTREEGKKGSQKVLVWTQDEEQAFLDLKAALAKSLSLFHIQVDKPFVLRTDASGYAIGAVLEQERDGKLVPVSFCSRKLNSTQRKWAPREQETYAIIMALRKWSGWIGYQPVVVLTDHRSLEHWTTEHVDTPSGPAGRRARWHETLSKFNIEVKYVPGKDNIVADALSRWAYPASQGLADVSKHGSLESTLEAHAIIAKKKGRKKRQRTLTRWRQRVTKSLACWIYFQVREVLGMFLGKMVMKWFLLTLTLGVRPIYVRIFSRGIIKIFHPVILMSLWPVCPVKNFRKH